MNNLSTISASVNSNEGTLNKFYRPIDSPVSNNKPAVSSLNFSSKYQIQSRFALLSNINVKNFIDISGTATVDFSINPNSTLNITTTSGFTSPHQSDKMFALPYITAYEGTSAVGSMEIYPKTGAGITTGNYTVSSGFNYEAFDGTQSTWTTSISNRTAGTKTGYFIVQEQFNRYNSGIAT